MSIKHPSLQLKLCRQEIGKKSDCARLGIAKKKKQLLAMGH